LQAGGHRFDPGTLHWKSLETLYVVEAADDDAPSSRSSTTTVERSTY
jgi:hypothetical protein